MNYKEMDRKYRGVLCTYREMNKPPEKKGNILLVIVIVITLSIALAASFYSI